MWLFQRLYRNRVYLRIFRVSEPQCPDVEMLNFLGEMLVNYTLPIVHIMVTCHSTL